jgi:3-hydroxybutyryl-CoA dehydrogenase
MTDQLGGLRVAVVGLGPMGRGIARVFAVAGAEVAVVDVDGPATEAGLARTLEEAEAPVSIRGASSIADAVAAADLVIEAIVERPEAKAELLAELRRSAPQGTVIASNTSSLSIGEMGAVFGEPARVVGMHFFNPPEKMRLVEVVRAPLTSPDVVERAAAWVTALGKTVVLCEDSPNFVVNRVCRPLYYEAQLLVTQGVAPATVDAVARGALGHRMGPLELLDYVGLQTHLGSSETALREFGDPRYRPIPRTRALVRAGSTGRAAGRGWYDYATAPPKQARSAAVRERETSGAHIAVTGPGREQLLRDEAVRAAVAEGARLVVYSAPQSCAYDDVAAVRELVVRGRTVVVDSSHSGWLDAAPRGVSWLRLHAGRERPFAEIVADRVAGVTGGPGVEELLGAVGAASVDVLALAGLVGDRLMHTIVNEALTVVEEGTALADDVDLAMKLGMNHPLGPLEYLAETGAEQVLESLRDMLTSFGDPRYRPAALLLRRAAGARRLGSGTGLEESSVRLPI